MATSLYSFSYCCISQSRIYLGSPCKGADRHGEEGLVGFMAAVCALRCVRLLVHISVYQESEAEADWGQTFIKAYPWPDDLLFAPRPHVLQLQ